MNRTLSLVLAWQLFASFLGAAVVINEIHYHPVEEAQFDGNGLPVLDLSEDVHEFLELYNPGTAPVSLGKWRIDSGVSFTFPDAAVIPGQGYVVIAKDPARLAAISQYQIPAGQLYGPYAGVLGNGAGETVRLKDSNGFIVDAVPYSSRFPWAIGADAFGASERWTGIKAQDWQYRGRSLERVSATHPSSDPANWLASPFPGNPSPGQPNALTRVVPLPAVIAHRVTQATDDTFPIRAGQPARVEISFSGTNELGPVRLEYFLDEINRTNETVNSIAFTGTPPHLSATLPGFAPRAMVRYRVLAQRQTSGQGSFEERVLPRLDDPFGWAGFFVVTNRTSKTPAYDLFASTNSLNQLVRNLQDNPNQGWNPPLGTLPVGRFNLTEPAILAYEGELYEVEIRHSGSFYRRDFSRNSFKVEFAAFGKLDGHSTLLILDKGDENVFGHQLFDAAGFPTVKTRTVDLYLNNQSRISRIEFEENDDDMLNRWAREEKNRHPELPLPGPGLLYKASGFSVLGPFGPADGSILPPNAGWTSLQRYEWVYSSKTTDWQGYVPLQSMLEEMWAARGPLPGTDIPKLRAYLEAKWDVPRSIDYVALRAWMSVRDDTYHNHMEWKQSNDLWTMIPWDFDGELSEVTSSIFNGENANWFKDAFFKAFRDEYKQRLWWLNNTFLHPENLAANGLTHQNLGSYAPARLQNVNDQTFGVFQRPKRPTNVSPSGGESVIGTARLVTSGYEHTLSPASPHTSTYWEIRRAEGTYRDAVYAVTSRVDLTSISIPFDRLEPGTQYFWRAVHHDAEGHPSLLSQESAFRFGGSYRRLELVGLGDTWKYDDSGTNYPRNWRELGFDDSAWKQGKGLFGVSTSALSAPLQTPLPLGIRTYYFRRTFQLPADPAKISLRVRHFLDDGAVYYLNGAEALRVNLSAFFPVGGLPPTQLASKDVPDAFFDLPINLPTTNLVAGENLIAVQVHQRANTSPDVVFGAQLEITVETGTGSVRLNELIALNEDAVAQAGVYPDWIELSNPTAQTIDLSGSAVTDDPALPTKFVFPANSLIGPQGKVVLWCKAAGGPGSLSVPFEFTPNGGGVWFYAPDGAGGWLEQDSIRFGLLPPNYALGRVPDGSGPWTLIAPSPGQSNTAAELGSPSALRINEWMANPVSGSDWFEIFNPQLSPVAVSGFYLSDSKEQPTNTQLPAHSYLGPWSFTYFEADSDPEQGANHVRFKLSGSGEAILLYDSAGRMIDAVEFGPQQNGISEGRLPDGAQGIVTQASGGSPGRTNRGDADADGLPDDWELANGLKVGLKDSQIDSDGDGADNLAEFLAGTDPRNASSVLRLEATWGIDGTGEATLRLRASVLPGKQYELQSRDSLNPGAWQTVETVGPTSAGSIYERQLPNPSEGSGKFYRWVLKRG